MARREIPARSRNISAAPARTSGAWCWGSSRSSNWAHAPPASRSTCGSVPLVLAPPMNRVGISIASASAFENGGRLSRACPIRVKALSRNCCFGAAGSRAQAPGPSIASKKNARPPSTSPAAILSAEVAIRAASGEGPGLKSGSSVASSSPPGSARISLRNKSGRCCATRNATWPPREWPIRSTGPTFELLDEADHVGDMLRDRIGVAAAVPSLGKKMPQADARSRDAFSTAAPARKTRSGSRTASRARRPAAALARHRDRPCRCR